MIDVTLGSIAKGKVSKDQGAFQGKIICKSIGEFCDFKGKRTLERKKKDFLAGREERM